MSRARVVSTLVAAAVLSGCGTTSVEPASGDQLAAPPSAPSQQSTSGQPHSAWPIPLTANATIKALDRMPERLGEWEQSEVDRGLVLYTHPQAQLGIEARRGYLGVRANAFVMEVQNEIHLDPFSAGIGNRNLPPTRRRGLELEITANPLTPLRLSAAYAYIDARFREGTLAGSAFGTSIAGKTVPLVPRHKLNLNASWDFNTATRLTAAAAYVGEQFMDNDEPNSFGVKIPAYTLVDLKLTHRRGAWFFAAALNNVFGEKYYNYAVRSQFVADRYNAYPLPERNGSVSVEYRFE